MQGHGARQGSGIGIVGCGNIFERYVTGMRRFPALELVGCADIDQRRAEEAAGASGLEAFASVDALLEDPRVDVVVNITPPTAHADISLAALAAGKHVYVEKPLAATTTAAQQVKEELQRNPDVRMGCAPDTFLGSAAQTARAIIDAGVIGEPIGVSCYITHTLADTWHPDPTLFFIPGGGPLLDMGPYSLTSMVNCLGPVVEIAGATRIGAPVRQVTTPNRLVDEIVVRVPTHASAVLRFESGVIGSIMASFDVWHGDLPYIEVDGTLGSLRFADPNGFDGDVQVRLNRETTWETQEPVLPQLAEPGSRDQMLRGLGVADLVAAMHGAAQHTSVDLAYHVLEILETVETSSQAHEVVTLTSTCARPPALTRDQFDALLASSS